MKTLLVVLLTGSALAMAAPAGASSTDQALQGLKDFLGRQLGQSSNSTDRDLLDQESRLTDTIRESHEQGQISDRQADRAFDQLRAIHDEENDLRDRDGGQLSQSDHDYLRGRLAGLDQNLDRMREASGYDQDRSRRDFSSDRSDIHERESRLEQQIRDGMDNGTLSRSDGSRELRQLRAIRTAEADYMQRDQGDLTDRHRTTLDRRLNALDDDLQAQRSNGG